MPQPVKSVCPLGGECESIKENQLHRCAWYCKLIGKDPQSGVEREEWGCAMAFLPVLLVEVAGTVRGVQAATESARNENLHASGQLCSALANLARVAQRRRELER